MRGPSHYARILQKQRHPLRFVAARALMQSGVSSLLRMEWHGYSLRFHPSNLSSHIWVDREARWSDSAFLRAWLRPGDVVVDIGANIGTTVLPASTVIGSEGRLLAVEAHPRLLRYLVANLSDNRVTNVDVHWCALGESAGTLSFSDATSDDRNGVASDGTLAVPMRTLDGVTAGLGPIDLLKIDVEGYELPVFRAGAATLARTSCVVFESFERHTARFGYKTTDLLAHLRGAGFTLFRAEPGNRLVRLPENHCSERCEDLVALRAGAAPRPPFQGV
jgi:FkbM family methyltransferase